MYSVWMYTHADPLTWPLQPRAATRADRLGAAAGESSEETGKRMSKRVEHASRTILVTGAAGVVGQALLRRLRATEDIRVLCLVHRSPVEDGRVESIRGDITRPGLGIPDPDYRRLVARVDAVVHAAATVDFSRPDDSLTATNVDGVRRVLDFASDADVPLYHVSTAYADAREDGPNRATGVRYARSKKKGDELVRSSGLPRVIIRPSVVIGNSLTGEVAAFQAVYQIIEKFLRGNITVFPFRPDVLVDLIPCDVVADAIAAVLEQQVTEGEYWVANGTEALTVHDVFKILVQFSESTGRPLTLPRFVSGNAATRLLDSLPKNADSARAERNAAWLSNYFGPYLVPDSCLPSSRPQLMALGVEWPANPAESLKASLRYWGRVSGFAAGDGMEF